VTGNRMVYAGLSLPRVVWLDSTASLGPVEIGPRRFNTEGNFWSSPYLIEQPWRRMDLQRPPWRGRFSVAGNVWSFPFASCV